MSELAETRCRIEVLRGAGLKPLTVVLSDTSWDAMTAEYRADTGRGTDLAISGREVLGVPVELHPVATSISIVYEGGVDTGEDS